MRELAVELKQLRMHGMAGAWADLVEQGGGGGGGQTLDSSRWRSNTCCRPRQRTARCAR